MWEFRGLRYRYFRIRLACSALSVRRPRCLRRSALPSCLTLPLVCFPSSLLGPGPGPAADPRVGARPCSIVDTSKSCTTVTVASCSSPSYSSSIASCPLPTPSHSSPSPSAHARSGPDEQNRASVPATAPYALSTSAAFRAARSARARRCYGAMKSMNG